MKPFFPQRSSFRRASSRWFAAGGIAAAIAATTLAACGPRDERPLAGGAAAVAPQTPPRSPRLRRRLAPADQPARGAPFAPPGPAGRAGAGRGRTRRRP